MAPTRKAPVQHDKRRINKSQRARESGEFVPGIDSALNVMLTPAASSVADDEQSSKQSTPTLDSRASQSAADDPAVKVVKRSARQRPARRTKTTTATRPSADAKEEQFMINARRHDVLQERALAFLRKGGFRIWDWDGPAVVDPLSLTPTERRTRENQDRIEALHDNEEDLDDWFVKSGNPAYYSDTHPILSLQYSIVRSFILRAKRAQRRGQTWEEFEDFEISIDSMSEVRKIKDDTLRAVHAREAIDNNSRLALFDRIRPRLCLEIWGQRYPVDRAQLVVGAHGNVVLKGEEDLDDRLLPVDASREQTTKVESAPSANNATSQSGRVNNADSNACSKEVHGAVSKDDNIAPPSAVNDKLPQHAGNALHNNDKIVNGQVLLGMTFDERYQPFRST